MSKLKTLIAVLGVTAIVLALSLFNTENAYAFGGSVSGVNGEGDHDVVSEIKTQFDSNGNLIVQGYLYIKGLQNYLVLAGDYDSDTAGTHSYRLLLGGKEYDCDVTAAHGLNLSYLQLHNCACGNKYEFINGAIYPLGTTCDHKNNTALKNVGFCFVVPKADILALDNGTYSLTIKHKAKTIWYNNAYHCKEFIISKLIDSKNLVNGVDVSKHISASGDECDATISTDGTNVINVVAASVYARQSASKTSNINWSFAPAGTRGFFTPYGNGKTIPYSIVNSQIAFDDNGYTSWIRLGTSYSATSSKTTTKTVTVTERIQPGEFFSQHPDLYNQYMDALNTYQNTSTTVDRYKYNEVIQTNKIREMLININPSLKGGFITAIYSMEDLASKVGLSYNPTTCQFTQIKNGAGGLIITKLNTEGSRLKDVKDALAYYEERKARAAKTMDEILSKCTKTVTKAITVPAYSSYTDTTYAWCPSIFLEAASGNYGTTLTIKNASCPVSYTVVTEVRREKGEAGTGSKPSHKYPDVLSYGIGTKTITTMSTSAVSFNGIPTTPTANTGKLKGYHYAQTIYVVEKGGTRTEYTKKEFDKKYTTAGSLEGAIVYVRYEYNNDPPRLYEHN